MSRIIGNALGAMAAVVASTSVGAVDFTATPALQEGDEVVGVGNVTRIDELAINDSGQWIVQAETDDPNSTTSQVLVRDGQLFLRSGTPITPGGPSPAVFGSVNIANDATSALDLRLSDGPPFSALYANTTLVAQEGSGVTAADFGAGSTFQSFQRAVPNNQQQLHTFAQVTDPSIGTEPALMLFTMNGAEFDQLTIVRQGQMLPGGSNLEQFLANRGQSAMNDTPQVIYVARDNEPVARYGAYLATVNGSDVATTVVARDGDASPIAGRNWVLLQSALLDVNSDGDHALLGGLTGDFATDSVLVFNDQVVAQEGDMVDIGEDQFTLKSFGQVLSLADNDAVLWYGQWEDLANVQQDEALFLNDEILLQEGVSMVGGQVVVTIRSNAEKARLSDNGRFVICELVLEDEREGAWILDLGTSCPADLDGDRSVGFGDLTILLGNWGPCPIMEACPADLDDDDSVGFSDLTILLGNWGPCP